MRVKEVLAWAFFPWLIVTLIPLPFVIGGIVLFGPLVPTFAQWLQSVTLYEFAVSWYGFSYAVLMCMAALSMGLHREGGEDLLDSRLLFAVLGAAILLLLLVGRFAVGF